VELKISIIILSKNLFNNHLQNLLINHLQNMLINHSQNMLINHLQSLFNLKMINMNKISYKIMIYEIEIVTLIIWIIQDIELTKDTSK